MRWALALVLGLSLQSAALAQTLPTAAAPIPFTDSLITWDTAWTVLFSRQYAEILPGFFALQSRQLPNGDIQFYDDFFKIIGSFQTRQNISKNQDQRVLTLLFTQGGGHEFLRLEFRSLGEGLTPIPISVLREGYLPMNLGDKSYGDIQSSSLRVSFSGYYYARFQVVRGEDPSTKERWIKASITNDEGFEDLSYIELESPHGRSFTYRLSALWSKGAEYRVERFRAPGQIWGSERHLINHKLVSLQDFQKNFDHSIMSYMRSSLSFAFLLNCLKNFFGKAHSSCMAG